MVVVDRMGHPIGFQKPPEVEQETATSVEMNAVAPDMTPVNSRCFVLPDAKVLRRGKILLPENDKVPIFTGVVLSSGSALCAAGDRIAFERMQPIEIDGELRLFVEEKHVVAVKRKA